MLERVNKFKTRCVEAKLLGFCLRSSRKVVVNFDGRFRFVHGQLYHEKTLSRSAIWGHHPSSRRAILARDFVGW